MGLMRTLAAAGALLVAAGCSGSSGSSCTLLGCTDQLTVKLGPPVVVPYGIHVTLDNVESVLLCDAHGAHAQSGSAVIVECDATRFSIQGAPVKAEIHVLTSAADGGHTDDINATFTPTYLTSQPNGPACQPTCRQATVTLL